MVDPYVHLTQEEFEMILKHALSWKGNPSYNPRTKDGVIAYLAERIWSGLSTQWSRLNAYETETDPDMKTVLLEEVRKNRRLSRIDGFYTATISHPVNENSESYPRYVMPDGSNQIDEFLKNFLEEK